MRWILVLITAALGGILAGLGLHFVDKLGFYLVVLMPLMAGILIGVATYLPVIRAHVPTPPLAMIAILGCAVALGVYWYGQYMLYQDSVVEVVQENDAKASREEALALLDEVNQAEYGATGFMGFLADYAALGVGIGDVRETNSAFTLQGPLAYGFWVFEALVMVVTAVAGVARRGQSGLTKRLNPQPA